MLPKQKIIILCLFGFLGLFIYWFLDREHYLAFLQDGQAILAYLRSLGLLGPVMIVLMMSLAIMISPLPSAPIAIAAGAAYGHVWGTVYVLLGSLCGAVGAFLVARYFGYEAIHHYADKYLPKRFYKSQNSLMIFVFVTRLMPFLSFDVISYAAGLTPLVFWRFVLATFFGIVPASFFLAHVGSELAATELDRISIALLVLAGLSMVLVTVNLFKKKK